VERRAEQLPGALPGAPGHGAAGGRVEREPEVVEPAPAPVRSDDLVRALVQHLGAQAVQHRQHGGQRHPRPGQQEPEVQLVGVVDQLQVRLAAQLADPAQVGQRAHRVDVVLVALR
jgi:hypothetical protein